MIFKFEEKPLNSRFIKTIWRTQSEYSGSFISTATSHLEMIVTKQKDTINLTVRGPETKATSALVPANAEFIGITFQLGIFLRHLPTSELVDGQVVLPQSSSHSFWFQDRSFTFPDFEDAEYFAKLLIRMGLLEHEPVVDAALQGQPSELSLRSTQRRFLRATGLTCAAVRQIERAKQATALLMQGMSIAQTIYQTGYADHSHLTRSLKRLIGRTPAQIMNLNPSDPQDVVVFVQDRI